MEIASGMFQSSSAAQQAAQSRHAMGTPFEKLPLLTSGVSEEHVVDVPASHTTQPGPMSQPSLLILDDDPQICRLLQAVFSAQGISAEALKEPTYALERLKRRAYDVVLLDVVMPDMSGMEVLERLRDLCPETKVIMMTGYADKNMAIEALRAGAFDFLEKPIDLDVLSHAVKHALEAQAMARAHQQALQELQHNQATLQAYASDLEQLNEELRETHQAMRVLARNADRARQEMEARLSLHLRGLLVPLLENMCDDERLEPYRSHLSLLEKAIEDAVAGLSTHLTSMPQLSTREIRIAMMIKSGMTTEEIAMQLHISPETVKTHRRNIRKKLGLNGMGDRLYAYLAQQNRAQNERRCHTPPLP